MPLIVIYYANNTNKAQCKIVRMSLFFRTFMFYAPLVGVTVADLRKKLALNLSEWSLKSTTAKLAGTQEGVKQETTFVVNQM